MQFLYGLNCADVPLSNKQTNKFLYEKAPLAALYITRHLCLYKDFNPQLVLILPTSEGWKLESSYCFWVKIIYKR